MIRFNLQLLPETPDGNPEIIKANTLSETSYRHLMTRVSGLKCKKHPSFRNVINVVAVAGKDPKIEVVTVCCPDFFKAIS